nr:EAL domain-containing protein [Sphingomonas changnyeongensis]
MFEITETSLVSDMVTARAALERLRRGGARIALDDFGTGYSSLAALHQLPIDMVKVDRSFAARLNDAAGRRLLSGIRGLAEALAIDCVLEGVETEAQLLAARRTGFTLVQGFHLARPMPIEQILALPSLALPLTPGPPPPLRPPDPAPSGVPLPPSRNGCAHPMSALDSPLEQR